MSLTVKEYRVLLQGVKDVPLLSARGIQDYAKEKFGISKGLATYKAARFIHEAMDSHHLVITDALATINITDKGVEFLGWLEKGVVSLPSAPFEPMSVDKPEPGNSDDERGKQWTSHPASYPEMT